MANAMILVSNIFWGDLLEQGWPRTDVSNKQSRTLVTLRVTAASQHAVSDFLKLCLYLSVLHTHLTIL